MNAINPTFDQPTQGHVNYIQIALSFTSINRSLELVPLVT